MNENEALDYLQRWFSWVDMQKLPEHTKKFLKKHPFMAPKDWEKDLANKLNLRKDKNL